MDDPRLGGLYAITPDNIADCTQLCTMVEAAAHGGARLVQYRDKHASKSQRAERAAALATRCARLGLALIINDDLELALSVGAAGVHLGRDDGDASDARRRAGADFIIGISCYDQLDTARVAARCGASYVAFGACFPSATKPAAVHATPALLTAARRELPVPIVAIGGITPENGSQLVSAGAHMLAVISGLFTRSDITAAARAYTALFS